jgi:prophage regulatory protein
VHCEEPLSQVPASAPEPQATELQPVTPTQAVAVWRPAAPCMPPEVPFDDFVRHLRLDVDLRPRSTPGASSVQALLQLAHAPSDVAVIPPQSGATAPSAPDSPEAYRIEPLAVEADEAARICGVGRTLWYDLRAAGRLPEPVRLGRRVLWRVAELRAWMAARCPPLQRWKQTKWTP